MTITVLDHDPLTALPGAYLHEVVDAATAARLLDISVPRWRQITGPQLDPNPALKPLAIDGVRGARWRLRDICRYALDHGRALQLPVPPLLPLDVSRYGARTQGAALATPTAQVWGQLLHPTAPQRCGQPENLLLILTALHATTTGAVVADLPQLLRAAAEVPDWSDTLTSHPAGLVIAIPTPQTTTTNPAPGAALPDGQGEGLVWAGMVGAQTLAAVVDAPNRLEVARAPWAVASWMAPASDVAGCLGWQGLPWWPQGTATAELCAQWAPGLVLELPTPPALTGHSRAAAWIAAQLPRGFAGAADYAELARILDPARDEHARARHTAAPAGYVDAVDVTWELSSPDLQRDPHPLAALDAILGDLTTPESIGELLISWMGDPRHAAPVHYRTADLPGGCVQAITDAGGEWVHLDDAATPRWRALLAAHERCVAEELAGMLHDCDLEARLWNRASVPVVTCEHGITLLAPTGYLAAGERRGTAMHPAGALQTEPYEKLTQVWLVPCADGRVTGLVLTDCGQILPLPLPGSPTAGRAGTAALWVSAWTGWAYDDVLVAAARRGDDPMGELLATTTGPRTCTPEELREIARRSLQVYHPGVRV